LRASPPNTELIAFPPGPVPIFPNLKLKRPEGETEFFLAVQVGIIMILQIKVVGLAYFIPLRIPKGFVIIHNSLTPQRWTLLFMTDSIHK
jgi:hypothetical protein